EFLVMEMDVIVAGGVSLANLRSHIELWDRLLQEFIAYLRDYSRLAAEQQGMAQDAGQPVDGEA
ncbi:TPA: YbjN domain-containing protein, partial [Pseudomonas aeruginosa]